MGSCGLNSVLVWACSLMKMRAGKETGCFYGSIWQYAIMTTLHNRWQTRYSVQNLGVCIHVAVGYVVFSEAGSCMNTQLVKCPSSMQPVCKLVLWLRNSSQWILTFMYADVESCLFQKLLGHYVPPLLCNIPSAAVGRNEQKKKKEYKNQKTLEGKGREEEIMINMWEKQ